MGREIARGHVIKIASQGQMTQDRDGRSGDGCSSGKCGEEVEETDTADNKKRQEQEMKSEKYEMTKEKGKKVMDDAARVRKKLTQMM